MFSKTSNTGSLKVGILWLRLNREEIIPSKGKKCWLPAFLLLPQCFQKTSNTGSLKVGILWLRLNREEIIPSKGKNAGYQLFSFFFLLKRLLSNGSLKLAFCGKDLYKYFFDRVFNARKIIGLKSFKIWIYIPYYNMATGGEISLVTTRPIPYLNKTSSPLEQLLSVT